jgi:chromosome segregation ATPase
MWLLNGIFYFFIFITLKIFIFFFFFTIVPTHVYCYLFTIVLFVCINLFILFRKRYFTCPAQTGLFVLASKVTPLDQDSDSVRSTSPPQQHHPQQHHPQQGRLSLITSGSRAARYIGMAATQLSQPNGKPNGGMSRSPSTRNSLQTPLTSPVSGRNSLRRSQPSIQSPPPQSSYSNNRGIPSPAATPTSHSIQDADDYYHDAILSSSEEEHVLTDTPLPASISKSTSSDLESPQERLERVLGEAINQAPDETVMRLQQLQLRVEVLEAENKYLKLENAQNKTAEQILERSVVLKKTGQHDEDQYFTLDGHKAVVQEIKTEHEAKEKVWTTKQNELASAVSRLEARVIELEAEQLSLQTERDRIQLEMSNVRKEKSVAEQRIHTLEGQVAEAEAARAAAQANEKLIQEKLQHQQQQNAMSPSQQYFTTGDDGGTSERQMQLEMEMEEVHEKMSSLREAARAKDMFLAALSEQVEQHRNAVEEKEREIRRIKGDSERHVREKERLLDEVKEWETKMADHQECASKESFDKIKKELTTVKENLSRESGLVKEYYERISSLQESVDELKKAGMESIELYESSVEMNRVDREAVNASLADERRKVSSLEVEREDLRKACLDAIESYEATIEEWKKERASLVEQYNTKQKELEATIQELKQEIDTLVKNVETDEKHDTIKDLWESERKRLTDELTASNEALEREKGANTSYRQEAESLKERTKEAEKLTKEKTKLEEQLTRLQADFDQELSSRNKYLDQVRAAVESQKKTESDLRKLTEAKDKMERELRETPPAPTNASSGIDEKQYALEVDTFRSEIEKLKAQNEMLMKQKEQAEQTQSDSNQYQQLVASLKAENKRLTKSNAQLEDNHKQTETECLKLMEEVEKLHAEQSAVVPAPVFSEGATEDDKINQLSKSLHTSQKQLEKTLMDHSTEIRVLKEKGQDADKENKRQVQLLNRDISELESLIESKIFREADLEEALETEKKQVFRLRSELQDMKEQQDEVMPTKNNSTPPSPPQKSQHDKYCELCEESGHDVMSCTAVSLPNTAELERPVSFDI